MRFSVILCAAMVAACTPSDETPSPEDVVTSSPPPGTVTNRPAGDYANLHIDLGDGERPVQLSALFVASTPGYVNLAQCAIHEDAPCLPSLPAIEEQFVVQPTNLSVDREFVTTRFQGREIAFAGYTLPYREDRDNGFGYYNLTLEDEEPAPRGFADVAWDGQWAAFEASNLLEVQAPLQLEFPRSGAFIKFHNDERVPFEWVPSGKGLLTLVVSSVSGLERMYLLEDDGYFELDTDSLGLTGLSEDVSFRFVRWDVNKITEDGHAIDLLATSSATFEGEYFNIGPREHVAPAQGCAEASGLDPLGTGGYWGELDSSFSSSYDPDCLAPGCGNGYEGFYKVEVPPKTLLQVDYIAHQDSGAVYLLSDCFDPGTCFDGSDFDPVVASSEFLSYFNPSNDLRRFYLTVDATGVGGCTPFSTPTKTRYTLDVALETLVEPPLVDTCEQAEDLVPIAPGNYYAEQVAFGDDLDCPGAALNGSDAVTVVEVPAGATLSVNVNMEGGDPGLYLLFQCDTTCAAAADASLGSQELLTYTNVGTVTERVFLVVDSKDGLLPFFMNISIF